MILLEIFPLVTNFFIEYFYDFVKVTENNPFFVLILFADKCIGGNWFGWHLNMTHFIFVNYAVSRVFLQTCERFSNEELEWIFGLISYHKTDWGKFIVSLKDNYFLGLRILDGYHGSKNGHFKFSDYKFVSIIKLFE